MQQQRPDRRTDEDSEPGTGEIRVLELPTETGTARVTLPPTADGEEAAAIAAAVHSHLDREDEAESEVEATNPWKLAGRLGVRSQCRLPDCERGQEWKTAARTR